MNSTDVNRAIRRKIRPTLVEQGFGPFTARSGWRHRAWLIDVINFQSRYHADVIGCTTFSFALNLGIYLSDVVSDRPLPIRAGQRRPEEYHCHVRRCVNPRRPGIPRSPDVWAIDENGANLEDTIEAVQEELVRVAIPWFAAFKNTTTVLAMLQGHIPTPDELTWLPGAPDSPSRNEAIGYIAAALGQRDLAAHHLSRALAQLREIDARFEAARARMPRVVSRHLEEMVRALLNGGLESGCTRRRPRRGRADT